MKIFIGPAGSPSGSSNVSDGIRKVRELGLNSMEVEFTYGVRMGKKAAELAGKTAKESDVLLTVHAPYYVNLCNTEKLDASMKRIMDSCLLADIMGARVVVFHAGFYGNLDRDDAFRKVEDACNAMSQNLDDMGTDVLLGIETTGKHSQFGTLEEVEKLCGKLRRCVPAIDWAHIYAREGGSINYKKIIKRVSRFGEFMHTHFSGIEFGEKGEKRHLPVSEKSPPFEDLAKALLSSKKDVNIICESPLLEKDALLMKQILEKEGYAFA